MLWIGGDRGVQIFQETGDSQRRSKLMLDKFVWSRLGEREKAHSSMRS